MRALWLEDRRLRLRDDVPIPAPPSGEALVRVIRAGICNTDIELTGRSRRRCVCSRSSGSRSSR